MNIFLLLLMELLLVVAVMAVGAKFLGKIAVRTAPKDIQEIILKRPDDPRWMTVVGIILMLLLLGLILGIYFYVGFDAVDRGLGFNEIFFRFAILMLGYKIFDMIFFDWILLTKLNIFQRMYPETIGCKGYEKFGFNLKSQIIKIVVFVLLAFAIAWILS